MEAARSQLSMHHAELALRMASSRPTCRFGLPGTLSDQQAWDVALYMNSHERPQDPRYTGSVEGTRHDFHVTEDSMYGREVAGRAFGATVAPKPFRPLKEKPP